MNNITLAEEIENILQGDSPEKTLYQRYRFSGEGTREILVLAMIGKLIEQNNRLQSEFSPRPRSRNKWMHW
ncbi:hypothetical protein NUR08_004423 [Salmonella enterica]|nr:hypothetical protein [Salmonella enterica]